MAYIYPNANEIAAKLPGVGRSVKRAAQAIENRASMLLRQHRDTGAARITLTHGDVDWFVSLDDQRGYPAAAAIEYGHMREDGRFVEGIHVLTRAVYG